MGFDRGIIGEHVALANKDYENDMGSYRTTLVIE